MLSYQANVDINRPADTVFDFVTNIENSIQWGDAVIAAWQETDGPIGSGTIVTERVKIGPVISELSWEITAFEPNRLCTFEGSSELGHSQTTYMFEELELQLGPGSRLTIEVSTELTGIYRFLKPFVRFSHKRNRQRSLMAIKRILEQDPPQPPGASKK